MTRKAVKRGSEGGSWKSAWHSQECLVTRWLPTLHQVRFGGGRLEKQVKLLAGRLPDLFGVNAKRVKDEIRDRLVRYQKECYQVLNEAFQDGRLTTETDVDVEALLAQDSPAAQAYQIAMAVVRMARQQLIMEARLDTAVSTLSEHGERLDQLEAAVGGEHVTETQAAQISQAVKTVAIAIGNKTKRNEFGGVYGELYRKYGITSYKMLPARKFEEAMNFLTEWHQNVAGDAPF